MSDQAGQKPTKYTGEGGMQRMTPAQRLEYYTWNNEVRRLAWSIAGGMKLYKSLPREVRMDLREAAKQLHELGKDVPTAHVAEKTERRGFVYIITNPAWPAHVKVGRAFDPESRLKGFQTGCPERGYRLYYAVYFEDCHAAEKLIHDTLADYKAEGEWFRILPEVAANVIDEIGGHI